MYKYDTNEVTIELKDIAKVVKKCWESMIVVSLACVLGLFIYQSTLQIPEFSSTATLYVLRQNSDQQLGSDSDFSLSLKLIDDCSYILKSRAVVDDVIERLELNVEYKELYKSISITNPLNTRILEVTVVSEDAMLSKKIVDEICYIGQEKIAEAMGFQQVNFYEKGTLETEPSNRLTWKPYALVALFSAIGVYGIYLIIFLLDDTVHTEEDVTQVLGLSILGDIPNVPNPNKKKYVSVRKENQ